MTARVTVAVLTHDRPDEVATTIARTLALPEAPPVVVVDNGSHGDVAASLRARFPAVTVIRLPRNRGAAARNVGVRFAETPYVALCDDDTRWEPGSLVRAAALFDAFPRFAVLTARLLLGDTAHVDGVSHEMGRSPLTAPPDFPGRAVLGFLAGASVVRRSAFLAAGGFEPRLFIGGEEELLAIDLAANGWLLGYAPDLVVRHYPSAIRDREQRRRLVLRNALWCTWARRPARTAVRRTMTLLRDPQARGAVRRRVLVEAVAGLPWVWRHRRVVPWEVEHALQLIQDGRVSGRHVVSDGRRAARDGHRR